MYLSQPPLALLHSRRATLTQSHSALPDAPVVVDARDERRAERAAHRRTATSGVHGGVLAARRRGARSLHRLADAIAPAERSALVR
ncbi:hypothetical protein [Cellulomonas palmilytica]|uniref:hypothetical protein n=1 Tax=Cellulomonas palmilytica TaxID=2608402 RepID=UPI001F31393D|nr:hypothetical protein [Cellulomonas palmilytica]UJP39126.1 hypothetical protein F1D97_12300 [Cellulomonas palmilytica]